MAARGRQAKLQVIQDRIVKCRRCPELRRYCRDIAAAPRKAYADWTYWGRPVPAFGDPQARDPGAAVLEGGAELGGPAQVAELPPAWVRISQPSGVTRIVCSHWAE